MDEIEKMRSELKALEQELVQTDQTIARLRKELVEAEKRRDELQPVWNRDIGAIASVRRKIEVAEAQAKRAHIWATAPVVKIEGRPDGRLIKLTPKQVHVMVAQNGMKVVYDRATGRTRWNADGRITNLEDLTK